MNPEDLGQLLDAHAPALVLFARQWCTVPEDVVQEAFIKLAGQRSVPGNPVAWLYTVVRNGARTAARSARRRKQHEEAVAERTCCWFTPSGASALDTELVTKTLHSLPIMLRETVVAHLWGGLTFEQVGSLTGVSASTAHRRYLGALEAIRERLRIECSENP
jgi:RNA polymerase sigma factor (sigma-70 family)